MCSFFIVRIFHPFDTYTKPRSLLGSLSLSSSSSLVTENSKLKRKMRLHEKSTSYIAISLGVFLTFINPSSGQWYPFESQVALNDGDDQLSTTLTFHETENNKALGEVLLRRIFRRLDSIEETIIAENDKLYEKLNEEISKSFKKCRRKREKMMRQISIDSFDRRLRKKNPHSAYGSEWGVSSNNQDVEWNTNHQNNRDLEWSNKENKDFEWNNKDMDWNNRHHNYGQFRDNSREFYNSEYDSRYQNQASNSGSSNNNYW